MSVSFTKFVKHSPRGRGKGRRPKKRGGGVNIVCESGYSIIFFFTGQTARPRPTPLVKYEVTKVSIASGEANTESEKSFEAMPNKA